MNAGEYDKTAKLGEIPGSINVRKARHEDIEGIMDVACSVGNSEKISRLGFLMDDYVKEYEHFKHKFEGLISELEYFFVAEDNKILGFLISYTREEWLKYNRDWIESTIWHPMFDVKLTDKFILVDKTAVHSGLTGKGIGSLLYKGLIEDIKPVGICSMFAETIISPVPNFASLEFRLKQRYSLAGIRYERYGGKYYTDLVYHKEI